MRFNLQPLPGAGNAKVINPEIGRDKARPNFAVPLKRLPLAEAHGVVRQRRDQASMNCWWAGPLRGGRLSQRLGPLAAEPSPRAGDLTLAKMSHEVLRQNRFGLVQSFAAITAGCSG